MEEVGLGDSGRGGEGPGGSGAENDGGGGEEPDGNGGASQSGVVAAPSNPAKADYDAKLEVPIRGRRRRS
jgi:hypothetical protein